MVPSLWWLATRNCNWAFQVNDVMMNKGPAKVAVLGKSTVHDGIFLVEM